MKPADIKPAEAWATARIQTLEDYNLELRLALIDVIPPHRKKSGTYCWCDEDWDVRGDEDHHHTLQCRAARACLVLPQPIPRATGK